MSGKKRRSKHRRPNETFSKGPISGARFGKNVFLQSHWSPREFAEVQKRSVDHFPRVVQDIDTLVREIADLVSELPPEQLLQRAWWQMAHLNTTVRAESDLKPEDGLALRMIDYIQSVIAAIPPAQTPRQEITEDEWHALTTKVEELFRKVTIDYQICLSAKHKADDPDLSQEFEEFRFKSQIYWCNVRGSRYQLHDPAYLSDVFLPHAAVLQDLFGVTGDQFVEDITRVWHSLSFGVSETFEALKLLRDDTSNAVEAKLAPGQLLSETELPPLFAAVIAEKGWEQRRADVFGRLHGTDLFDVQKTTRLPQTLLDQLSWTPGEEKRFFAEGDFKGWPLRIWPIVERPFIHLNGRYYCFDLYSLFDNLYRVMQRLILRLRPDYQEIWNKTQQNLSEELPFKYLQQLLPGASVSRQVYYRGETESGKPGWCEADGFLIYDDHLLIIESRGGAFTYTPPATDFPAYVASLRNLVLKPVTQGRRFLEYLNTAESVPLFDRDHRQGSSVGESSGRSRSVRSPWIHSPSLPRRCSIYARSAWMSAHIPCGQFPWMMFGYMRMSSRIR